MVFNLIQVGNFGKGLLGLSLLMSGSSAAAWNIENFDYIKQLLLDNNHSRNVINDDSSRPFKIKIRTTNEGKTTDTQFELPTYGNGYNYNIDCDSDGQNEATSVTANYICNYQNPGEYTLSISGNFPQIYFKHHADNTIGDEKKLISIEQWGTQQWRSLRSAFQGCSNMTSNASDKPNLSKVTDMSLMFEYAKKFNADIANWDVSHVKMMYGMFHGASEFNQDIGSWDVSHVESMSFMFKGAKQFNQNIGNWDVSRVRTMAYMFSNTENFNQDIGNWDVRGTYTMLEMFRNSKVFNQDIGNWDVSNVFDMTRMFSGAEAFNQNIGNWDTHNVDDMPAMFLGAKSFNQDIGHWDVSGVFNMEEMFLGAISFDQNLADWDVSNVLHMDGMFHKVKLATRNYDHLLNGWSQLSLKQNVHFDAGTSKYSPTASQARDNLINTFQWKVVDGGVSL